MLSVAVAVTVTVVVAVEVLLHSLRDKAYAVHPVPAGKETPGPAVGGRLGHQSERITPFPIHRVMQPGNSASKTGNYWPLPQTPLRNLPD